MIPQCGGQNLDTTAIIDEGTASEFLSASSSADRAAPVLEFFSGGHISGTDESTPVRKERFGEFGILRTRII
jgi:hypothetical protein